MKQLLNCLKVYGSGRVLFVLLMQNVHLLHCRLVVFQIYKEKLIFPLISHVCTRQGEGLTHKYASLSDVSHWKLHRETVIIPHPLLLLLTLCIICSFRLSVKKRVNVSEWMSPGIRCFECWPGYCELGSAAPVWFPACSLHNGSSLCLASSPSIHACAGCICSLTGSPCVFVRMRVCVQQILYVTDPLVWDDAVFTVPPLPLLNYPKAATGKKVSVIPSPDQILLFNPRLWTFGLASRSGPGAGGWRARRETSCWAGRFSGADKQEAAQKLWWPAFASICCSGSPTRTAWCSGLRLWMGPLGHPFWLTHWVWDAFFPAFFLHHFTCLCSIFVPVYTSFLPIFHCFDSFFSLAH